MDTASFLGLMRKLLIMVIEGSSYAMGVNAFPLMVTFLIQHFNFSTIESINVMCYMTTGLVVLYFFIPFSLAWWLRRSKIIQLGYLSCLLGVFLLWLTTLLPPHKHLLYAALICLTTGVGLIRACSLSVSTEQEQVILSGLRDYSLYYLITSFVITICLVAVIILHQHGGWSFVFGFSSLAMCVVSIIFHVTLECFIDDNDINPGLFRLICVLWKALKNCNLELTDDTIYHFGNQMQTPPTEFLRWLNKACVINPGNEDQTSVCSVEDVQKLKSIIGVIPLWISSIMVSIACSPGDAFQILQSRTVDNPWVQFGYLQSSVYVFFPLLGTGGGLFVYLILRRLYAGGFNDPIHLMNVGVVFSIISMICFSLVEIIRKTVIHLSLYWLLPQYVSMGLSYGFYTVGSNYFYDNEIPACLTTLTSAFSGLSGAIGSIISIKGQQTPLISNWMSEDINKGNYQNYYLILVAFSILNWGWFLYFKNRYGPLIEQWMYGPAPEQANAPELANAPEALDADEHANEPVHAPAPTDAHEPVHAPASTTTTDTETDEHESTNAPAP